MKIKDLFDVHQGNSFELANMELSETSQVHFVSRTARDNGVVAKVCNDDAIVPFSAGLITVALGGSVLSAFVQTKPFYTAFHVAVLSPRKPMSLAEKLFYCMCIRANAYRYTYGRQANKTLKEIGIPDTVPQWVYTTSVRPITTQNQRNAPLLSDIRTWGNFRLEDIFVFRKGKRLTKEEMLDGSTHYIGAISNNNGVRQMINAPALFEANCITVNYNGSVGEAFYQSEPFWASDDVNVLYPKDWKLNPYIGLFLATIIKANRYQFGYGRKWKLERMRETTIKLPVTADGDPDWVTMEHYIRSLPYADRI